MSCPSDRCVAMLPSRPVDRSAMVPVHEPLLLICAVSTGCKVEIGEEQRDFATSESCHEF